MDIDVSLAYLQAFRWNLTCGTGRVPFYCAETSIQYVYVCSHSHTCDL